MWRFKAIVSLLCTGAAAVFTLDGQTSTAGPKAGSDVLIFVDGEKLIGHLESATSSSVVFKSDMAGPVTVDWSKIQELRSSEKFVAIPKGVKLRTQQDASAVPQGTLDMTGQQLQVNTVAPAAPKTLPIGDVSNVVREADFQKAFERTSLFKGWKGGATAGISLTEATQKNQTITAAVNMVRTVPAVNWLDVRSRTILDFNEAYGKLTQPGSPTLKTSLYHAAAEEDWYRSPRLFLFGQAIFDHSFSQGLDLQQTYGGGLGFVVFKRPKQELDFKASLDYIDYRFQNSSLNKHLFGSIFGETYVQTFAHGILFNEQAGITPAWTDVSAYSAFASAALTFPVYHHFGLTVGALDNFLNIPPPGFKKNSFQFTVGATYSFQ
ncbi:MAG TPA: DUF481 domain-containing protein [Bryobacteraceae bacterium]|nr:DUF481 domain-containing protein [Bryobacteraceae bacterium]